MDPGPPRKPLHDAPGDVRVGAGVTIDGSIRAPGRVHVGRDACVKGDVLAGGNVVIEEGARVEGNIFTPGTIKMGLPDAATRVRRHRLASKADPLAGPRGLDENTMRRPRGEP